MKIGICGDSYMASVGPPEGNHGYGKHFTDLMEKRNGWDIIMLARGGCTNLAIRLQINEMLEKFNPDFILVATTTADRIEIPIYGRDNNEEIELRDINYTGYFDMSSKYFEDQFPTHISQNLNSLMVGNYPEKDMMIPEQKVALKHYISYLFSESSKRILDKYMMMDGIAMLKDSGIPFYVLDNHLLKYETRYQEYIIPYQSDYAPFKYYMETLGQPQHPFHTTDREQEILYKLWTRRIKEEFGLGLL